MIAPAPIERSPLVAWGLWRDERLEALIQADPIAREIYGPPKENNGK